MKIGYLFPGQGAQAVGMGKDLYEKYETVRKVYDRVKEITGIDIAKFSFEGPEEVLFETRYTQLAILTMSLAINEVLKENGIKAEVGAGLSLGEYSALMTANGISFDEGVKLVEKRGEYMQNLVPDGEWLMAAILGMTDEQVIEVCEKTDKGFVVPANFNCPGQVVISGDKEGIEAAEIVAKEMGARKVRVLKTAGPFHTAKLTASSDALRVELEKTTFNKLDNVVIKNLNAECYSDDENYVDVLAKHIISPVKFSKSLNKMLDLGIDTFVEIGPGKTLTGFVKKIETDKELQLININNVESLEAALEILK